MRRRLFVAWIVCSAISASAQVRRDSTQLVFWAFGDVNLGRSVGKELLKGNVDYPFEHVRDSLRTADVVFVNLESQLSDQGGETQNPKDVYAFCGPPEGALSLRKANISVVSTANNHAYDYGMRGLRETIESLQKEDVQFTGTSQDSVGKFPPVFIEKNGIRLGILSYTEFVNRKGGWQGRISVFDRKRARLELAAARKFSDIVIASYHGGSEYTDEPNKFTQAQIRFLADAGADIVLGHHPHVPQGIEQRNGSIILYSLGNFVFYQPQHYWTQTGIGVEFVFTKRDSTVGVTSIRLLPVRAGKQPRFELSDAERTQLCERLQQYSNVTLQPMATSFQVVVPQRD